VAVTDKPRIIMIDDVGMDTICSAHFWTLWTADK
jgi:hypothetical protein